MEDLHTASQESAVRSHAFARAAVVCTAAAASFGVYAEASQASYAPDPTQQAYIDQALAVGMSEFSRDAPGLVANYPCKGILKVAIGTPAELFNREYGTYNNAQAVLFPGCEIQLNPAIIPPAELTPEVREAKGCVIIKHELGHILGLDHTKQPTDLMYEKGPQSPYLKQLSAGCVAMNRPIILSDKQMINLTITKTNLHVNVCRTDVLHKNKGYRAYYCAERLTDKPSQKVYDRFIIRTNQPYTDSGDLIIPEMETAFVSKDVWTKNRKRGGAVLK